MHCASQLLADCGIIPRPLDRIEKRPPEPLCVVLMTYEIRGQNVISHGSFLLTHHNGGCCCSNLRTTTLKNVNNSKFFFHKLFLTNHFIKFGLFEKHSKFEKNLPYGFDKSADLLSELYEIFFKICVLLRKSEL